MRDDFYTKWVFSFVLGVVLTLIFVMTFSALTGPIPLHEACPNCTKMDQIKIAASIGRLDFVAMALTVLGIGLGFFAIFSFVTIRNDAREAARISAKEQVDENYDKIKEEIISSLRESSRPNNNSGLDSATDGRILDDGDLEQDP